MPRYHVTVEGRDFDIELEYQSERYRVKVDGKEFDIEAHSLGESRFLLLVNKESHEVDVRTISGDGEKIVFMRGMEIPVTVEDYHLAQIRKRAATAVGPSAERYVRAPMPGMVVTIKVAPGDKIVKGQPLVVIEAMKMENIIKAKADATVKTIIADQGKSVEKGDTLLELS